MIAVCAKMQATHTIALCRQSVEFVTVKPGDTKLQLVSHIENRKTYNKIILRIKCFSFLRDLRSSRRKQCYAVSVGIWLPASRRFVVPSSSDCLTLKMKAL
jgi:hypothetical protein